MPRENANTRSGLYKAKKYGQRGDIHCPRDFKLPARQCLPYSPTLMLAYGPFSPSVFDTRVSIPPSTAPKKKSAR